MNNQYNPRLQLKNYMDELLSDLDEELPPKVKPQAKIDLDNLPPLRVKEPTPQQQQLQRMLDALSPIANIHSVPSSIEAGVVELAEPIDLTVDGLQSSIDINQWQDNGRPGWAQAPFEVLIVDIGGLHLAIPLITLTQISPIDDKLHAPFGQASWLLGLQKTHKGMTKLVDTAELIMPERPNPVDNYRYALTIADTDWAMAVDAIHQPFVIEPEAIRWRPRREQRPWMAGTVKDHLCVLIDIPTLGNILSKNWQTDQL